MPARRYTDDLLARAAALRECGLPLSAIARELGMSSPSSLSWHFLKLAVDPPKPAPLRPHHHLQCPLVRRGNHVVRAFTPAEDARLLALEAQGLGMNAIGRQLGRAANSVRGRLMTLARREEREVRP